MGVFTRYQTICQVKVMMLRLGRRSARGASGASRALGARGERQFWGSALSWLRSEKDEKPAAPAAEKRALEVENEAGKAEFEAEATAFKEDPAVVEAVEAATGGEQQGRAMSRAELLRRGGATVRGFSHVLSSTSSSAQLLDMWATLSTFEPFVVENSKYVPLADSQNAHADADQRPESSLVLQMLPCEVYARLSGRRSATNSNASSELENEANAASDVKPIFRKGSAWTFSEMVSSSPKVPALETRGVVLLNESAVGSWMVDVMARLKDRNAVIEFFKQYNLQRNKRINSLTHQQQQQLAQIDGETEGKADPENKPARKPLMNIKLRIDTLLSREAYVQYIEALEGTKQYAKLIGLLRKKVTRREYCTSIATLRTLLYACVSEKEGDVARAAIEDFTEYAPAVVIPLQCYETAIRANTIGQPRTEHDLENALAIVRKLRGDAEYLLNPSIWNTLLNSCVYLELSERALTIFKTYEENKIAPYQRQFLNAFRSACRFGDYELVLDMTRYWMETSRSAAEKSNVSATRDQREALNTILWEMLKGKPSVDQVKCVLRMMQDWSVQSGAILLRRAVTKLLEDEHGNKSPRELLENSIAFWKELPRVMVRQGFLIHLLLEHSLANGWADECVYLVDLALAHKVVDVPQSSLTKYMEANELRGLFAETKALGDRLAAERTVEQLGQTFFEQYLMSYQRLELFDEVLKLDRKYALTQGFPSSETLATIVRDAKANR